MDKQTFLDTLHGERAQWDAQVAQVDEERMTQPGFAGKWSLKDVIAHIAVYEEWTANEIQRALRGEQPEWDPELTGVSDDERNARLYEQQRRRTLTDTLAFSRRAYQQLVEAIQALSNEEFNSTDGLGGRLHSFWVGRPLWEGLVGNAYQHYREHAPDLKAWLDAQAEVGKSRSVENLYRAFTSVFGRFNLFCLNRSRLFLRSHQAPKSSTLTIRIDNHRVL